MAEILLSLRRHHFLYFSAHKRRDDMEIFLEEAKTKAHPAGKRKTSPVPHEPGVRIIYRNGQGNARAVLLPDL